MSNFGKKLAVAGQKYIPTVIGESYGGGYYAGRLKVDGQAYVVILAPKGAGESASYLQYATTASVNDSFISRWDGDVNMAAMVTSGITKYPAAQWCKGLTIGGYTDWVLPSEDQLDLCYRAFRPANAYNGSYGTNPSADPPLGLYSEAPMPAATTIPAFMSGGAEAFGTADYYLTSFGSAGAVTVMTFNGGTRAASSTSAGFRVTRAVRMEKVKS